MEGGADNCRGDVLDAFPFVVGLETLSFAPSPPDDPSETGIFFGGIGVEEADERPLLGLEGSFFE